jgi:hypothetical protein
MRAVVRRFLVLTVTTVMLGGLVGVLIENPAAADTDSFSSASAGTTGNTPVFGQAGPWLMSWSYNCSNFGAPGNFSVEIDQPSSDLALDIGPNEEGSSGSGMDYYYDPGSFQLSVNSECDWTISVAPSGDGVNGTPVTYTSAQTGDSGDTQQFSVASTWTMSWSYDCSKFGSSGNFSVNITQPAGDSTFDAAPNEVGPSGSGTDTYTDHGVFSLDINSECTWSITIDSLGSPAPAPAPAPTAPLPPKAVGIASTPDGGGYWIAYANGAVSPHGNAGNYGGVSDLVLNAPINHIVATPDGRGYWLVAADGGTFTKGDAQFYGSTGSMHLNAPIVDMAPTPDGGGYWLVGADGGIFSYGDAVFHGSTGSLRLNQPVVGMAPDPNTGGYWLVATDGGIFAFDAPFYGSTGSIHLNKPVNGMAETQDGLGYWFVASDGGIFDYGDAPFHGSAGSLVLNAPIVGMAPDFTSGGYWLLGSDGGIFSYDAPFLGSN